MKFLDCGAEPIGLYPIVDSVSWLEKLLPLGVKTIQLRLKNKNIAVLEQEIKLAVSIANQFNARLFINDYWELAIRYHAYGIHLGQEDLESANIEKIYHAGLRLGISTHSDDEIKCVSQLNPSYLAFGPIYHTTSKTISFKPQGISCLQRVCRNVVGTKIVAVGGITFERMSEVLSAGVDGIAVISAITRAHDPIMMTKKLLEMVDEYQKM